MTTKVVQGIVVRQVRPTVWVSENADVWLENVGVPSKAGSYTTSRWHSSNAKTRVKVNGELRYRLVAEAWVENLDPETLTIVNHLDGNSINDVATNLEWCTVGRNTQHAYDIGLNSNTQSNENLRRFTDDEEIAIHADYISCTAKNRRKAISEKYGISISLVKKINKKWR